jgi:hypothetical protein
VGALGQVEHVEEDAADRKLGRNGGRGVVAGESRKRRRLEHDSSALGEEDAKLLIRELLGVQILFSCRRVRRPSGDGK